MTVSTQRSPGSAPAPDRWEVYAEQGRLHDAVVAFVRERDWVTPAELQERFAAYFPTRGTFAWESATSPGVVFWEGLSEVLIDAILDLLRTRSLFAHPCSWWLYVSDGAILTLPLVKGMPPPGGFKRRHWAPTALRVVPLPAEDGARAAERAPVRVTGRR
jgi:hypothetical protein